MTARGPERLRIAVSGMMGSLPVAGLISHYLQYVVGLQKLGHDVLYIEDTGFYFEPVSKVYVDKWVNEQRPPPEGMPPAVLDRLLRPYGLGACWLWVDPDGVWHSPSEQHAKTFLRDADLFLHVSGATILRDEYAAIPRRAYIDTDPGFVQMRAARNERRDTEMLAGHNIHFSFGCNVGRPGCGVPELGLDWLPTVQPTDLALWPEQPSPPLGAPLTTLVKWKPYPWSVTEHEGIAYGMKDFEFLKFLELPSMTDVPFELAMDGSPPVPESRLVELGWRLAEGLTVSRTVDTYRDYIRSSFGEWSVAKQAYVATNSGWFSERSASYLASGRPVLLQSTGFDQWLPVGKGVFAFSTAADVLDALDALTSDYEAHCRAARDVAYEYFRSDLVLQQLLNRCGRS